MKFKFLSILAVVAMLAACEEKQAPDQPGTDQPGTDQPGTDQPALPSGESVQNAIWVFSSADWQAEFAKSGAATAELPALEITLENLTVKADAKCKYGETYFQMPGSGSPEKNHFAFNAAAAGALSVVESHTGSTAPDPVRSVTVNNNGTETTLEGSLSSKDQKELKFNVAAGPVYIYPTGGMRFYKIVFTAGASVDPGTDQPGPGDEPQPANPEESADLECPNPPTVGTVDQTALAGYGEKVTGGQGGAVLHFNSGKALQTWLLNRTKTEKKGDHSPVTIWLSGTFNNDDGRDFSSAHPWFDVKDVSNLSFIGTDSFVMNQIGIFCVRANNIIIRNINFQQPKASNGADAVSMQECDGVWVDHCTFTSLNQTKDYEDGSTDVTHGSKNVTVSWCRYIKTQKSCLVGHSNSQSGDTQITATFHHNWFEGSSSRHPRVRFGKVHVYNNFFDGNTTYGVGSAYGAKVLVEYNYFNGVQLPTDICTYPAKESGESNLQGSVAGYLYPTQNIYVNRPAKAKDPYPLSNVKYEKYNGSTITPLTYADFAPAYNYTVTAAEDVPTVVKAGAGYGKLGFTEAPVAVNNGGVTTPDATDDNPENPPVEDIDDPIDPTAAHVFTLSMESGSPVQTIDGAAGTTYFDASSSKADFSKDYSSTSFTIGGKAYDQGFKMDSKGYVKFTTSGSFTSTLHFYAVRRKAADTKASMQLIPSSGEAKVFDVTPYDSVFDSGEVTLEKGVSYELKQKSSEQAVILVVVTERQ